MLSWPNMLPSRNKAIIIIIVVVVVNSNYLLT